MRKTESVGQDGGARYELLDGLRGVAAAVVLFAHACDMAGSTQHFEKKYMAVYFFFMLSGFVVACAYEKRMRAGMRALQFYLRRAIRLYPLLLLGTLFCVGYLAAFNPRFLNDPSWLSASTLSALGLPFPYTEFNPRQFPVNPPGWSLFYELIAYAVFGLVATYLRTWLLVVGSALLTAVFAFVAHFYQGHSMPMYATIFTAAAPFVIGILLWRNHDYGFIKLPPMPFWVLAALMVAICAVPDSINRSFDALITVILFPLIIISGAAHGNRPSGAAMKMLGDLSYPVYILHWPFLLAAVHFLRGKINPLAVALCGCAAALCAAWLALRYYDAPLRRYLNGSLRRNPQPVGSASVSSATSS